MPRLPVALHRIAASGAAFAAFALAGCSDAGAPSREIAPDGASLSQTPDVIDPTGRHVFHTKTWFDNEARSAKPGSGGTTTNTGIYYHGGPVLQAVTNVVAIYWASSAIFNGGPSPSTNNGVGSGDADGSLVGTFLRGLGGSPYFNINSTYTDGSGAHITNAVKYVSYWANSAGAPSGTQVVTDADMVAMLQSGFDQGTITYDPSTVYAIFTSGAVNLGEGYTNPPQYCAYHYHGTVTVNKQSKTVLYAAMPYNAQYPRYCTSGLTAANGDLGADAEVNTLAHEIEESTTDPLGTAWWDHRGYENADKCAWTWGTTFTGSGGGTANVTIGGKDFLIQRNWVNSGSGGCYQQWP